MFSAGPNFLSQPKNLTAFSASSKLFCASKKTNFTHEYKSSSRRAQYVNDFLVLHKKFRLAQTFLQPVKGQSICCLVESRKDQGKI